MGRRQIVRPGDVYMDGLRPFGRRQNQEHLIIRSPWSALLHAAKQGHQPEKVRFCISQAESLFQNARDLGSAAKPLLFYYAALNLAKGFIASRESAFNVGDHMRHGLHEPRQNWEGRVALDGNIVYLEYRNGGGVFSQFFGFAAVSGA